MNSLTTNINGGFPWVLDDFRWHNDQEQAFANSLISGLCGGVDCIVSGVVLTSGVNVSAGYLFLSGELVRVDAHTAPDLDQGGDFHKIIITESFDSAGLKSLEDGGTGNAYNKRRATLTVGNFPVGSSVRYSTLDLLPEIVGLQGSTPWITVNATDLTVSSGTIDEGTFSYRVRDNRVEVSFSIGLTLGDINQFSITPPSAVIGDNVFSVLTHYSDNDALKVAHITKNGLLWNVSRDAAEAFAAGSVTLKGEFSYKI